MTSTPNKSTGKITRTRLVTSCSECSRRKQKCNKKWPCDHCLGRKSPQLCQFSLAKSKAKQDSVRDGVSEPGPRKSNTLRDEPEAQLSIGSSSTVLEALLTQKHHSDSLSVQKAHEVQHVKEDMLKDFPKRTTVDILVRHFFSDVNWLYEEVDAVSFLQRYDIWWNQTHLRTDADLQFAILILRMCVNSSQFLPNSTALAALDGKSSKDFEKTCNGIASRFDAYRPRKSTLQRVRQLLLQIATLLNSGDAKESHHILGEAIKEARGVGLFLETQWTGLSEYEKEERRMVFWYLYVWDRFHCTFLGQWPLIPEHYHSVQYPSETPWSISSTPNTPTMFTDVILNFRLNHYMASFMSAPGKEYERTDPYIVAARAKDFHSQFLNTLPSGFQLANPDTSWDEMIPSLPKKRLAFHITLHSVIEGMHKCFVGPLTPDSIKAYITRLQRDENAAKLIVQHRHTLAQSCIDVIATTRDLHELVGGGAHRYFVIPVALIEASAMLGMMIISDLLLTASSHHIALLQRELLLTCHTAFQEGFKSLQVLAQNSVWAQKGLGALEGLDMRISSLEDFDVRKRTESEKTSDQNNTTGGKRKYQNLSDADDNAPAPAFSGCQIHPNEEENVKVYDSFFNSADEAVLQQTSMDLEWETFCAGNDISCFLEYWNSFGDGSMSDLLELGGSFT